MGFGTSTIHACWQRLKYLKTGAALISCLALGYRRIGAKSGRALAKLSRRRVETGDGNVTLEIPGDLAADVSLHTGDGHIDLDMPVMAEGKLKQNEIHGKLNGGGKLMTIHTGDGSIHLRKG